MALGDADSRSLGGCEGAAASVSGRRVGTDGSRSSDRGHRTPMATALVHRAQRSSTPESVDADLVALWRELADRGPFARAVMSNLVVFRTSGDDRSDHRGNSGTIEALLDRVIASHPSRTIVLEHDRSGQPETFIGTDVSVSVFGQSTTPYGVEKIVVRCACTEGSLASIVRTLIRGQIPTSLWWTDDLSRLGPLAPLVAMSRQIVFDSRQWQHVADGIRALAPIVADDRTDLADVNWQRLTPFRRALAHAASAISAESAALRVTIAHRTGDAALAWLLAGWLASRLDLPSRLEWPQIQPVDDESDDEVLSLTLDSGSTHLDV